MDGRTYGRTDVRADGRTDGRTDGHLRPALLGRLGGVDLNIVISSVVRINGLLRLVGDFLKRIYSCKSEQITGTSIRLPNNTGSLKMQDWQ